MRWPDRSPVSLRLSIGLLLLAGAPAFGGEAPGEGPNPWYQSGRQAALSARNAPAPARHAKNAILFIGDGMGVPTVTAARILAGQLRGDHGEANALRFEGFPWLALAKTYNTNQMVPDSAGTITAILSGVKTDAGVLGVHEGVTRGDAASATASRVPTIFEEAEARGLSTGLVTTSRITHATPAGAYAHTPERDWESDGDLPEDAQRAGFPDIALQWLDFSAAPAAEKTQRSGFEVTLGGGRREFLPRRETRGGRRSDGRDLIAEWRAADASHVYVEDRSALLALEPKPGAAVLGLFADSHLDFDSDRRRRPEAREPSLAEMTRFAIRQLRTNPKGWLLLVEGARIDHAHHANNAYRALHDTLALDAAVEAALELVDLGDTLVIVTADHGHPISLRGYATRGNPILGVVVGNDRHGNREEAPSEDLTGAPFTLLSYAGGPGYPGKSDSQPEGPKRFPHFAKSYDGITGGRHEFGDAPPDDPSHLQEATLPLPYGTHSGEDVPVYATGAGSDLVHGVIEQHVLYHIVTEALGWHP